MHATSPSLTECRTDVRAGKSLAYTRVDFYNAQGQLAAYGREYPALSWPVRLRMNVHAD